MNESAIHKMTLFARNIAILLKIIEVVLGEGRVHQYFDHFLVKKSMDGPVNSEKD